MKNRLQTVFARIWLPLLVLGSAISANAVQITDAQIGNVTTSGFTVFWQATEAAEPAMSVYSDPDGFAEITDAVRVEYFPLATGDVTIPHEYVDRTDRRALQEKLRENGLFLARVSNLDPGTAYYVAAKATTSGDSATFPAEGLLEIKTAEQTAFIGESLQVSVGFPHGDFDGFVASLSTPAASSPLLQTIGDSGASNRAFFNLSDFVNPVTGTNLEVTDSLPLTIRLHRPGELPDTDDGQAIPFTQTFTVAKVTDLIFSGSGTPPQVVSGFAFAEISTQTAGIPFEITVRALDALGNPVTDFTGVAELAGSGTLLGGGTTAAFVDGVLADHPVAIEAPGEYRLTARLPDGTAETESNPFLVADSFERWLISQFPNPEDRDDPLISGPEADPFGTGIQNLLAYATGTDPRDPDRNRLPQPLLHEIDESGSRYLAITFAREKGAAEIDFVPEVSGQLGGWHFGDGFTEEVAVLDQGDFELVTVRDTVSFDEENRRFMRLRVRTGSSFSAWQARYFSGDQFADPTWSGAAATPAGDGISNLMKYALGLNPHTDGTGSLPATSKVAVDDETFLTLSYVRPKNRTDIEYIIEFSDDQATWYSGGSFVETLFAVDRGQTELIIIRDIRPLGEGELRSARLNVRRR